MLSAAKMALFIEKHNQMNENEQDAYVTNGGFHHRYSVDGSVSMIFCPSSFYRNGDLGVSVESQITLNYG